MKNIGKTKKLNKFAIVLITTLVVYLAAVTSVFATGWHKVGNNINNPNSQNPQNIDAPDGYSDGSSYWRANSDSNNEAKSPHGGYATSSNKCETCHSEHDADGGQMDKDDSYGDGSFKLLRNKTRATECNVCHDVTSGVTDKKPYKLGTNESISGEHTIGSTVLPDSDSDKIFNGINKDGLLCGSCHSVHGAGIMSGNNVDPNWTKYLLRKDPGGNGGDAGVSTAYSGGDIDGGFDVKAENSKAENDYAGSKTAWCADCHNTNSNWDMDTDDNNRPNSASHVQGPAADGLMDVDGIKTRVANFGNFKDDQEHADREGWRLKQNTTFGCVNCHQAKTAKEGGSFPHQSKGSKLLMANYSSKGDGWRNKRDDKGIIQSTRGKNKAERVLVGLDKVCIDCHRKERGVGDDDSLGVGKHF